MIVGWERSRESEVRLPFFLLHCCPTWNIFIKTKFQNWKSGLIFNLTFSPPLLTLHPEKKERKKKNKEGEGSFTVHLLLFRHGPAITKMKIFKPGYDLIGQVLSLFLRSY
jgi:hypothetical protein